MQKEKFQEYLHNPEGYKNADLSELEELTREYPWFSTAGIILLLSGKMQSDPDFVSILKKQIITIPDRKFLQKQLQPISGPSFQMEDPSIDMTAPPELHSRIPGMFDTLENEAHPKNIRSETSNSSVLEDDSLLEFSYSTRKSDAGATEKNETGFAGTGDLNSQQPDENSEVKASPETGEQNFDHWISKLGGESTVEKSPFKRHEIIDSFMHSDPGVIRADKDTRLLGDVSKGSSEENEGFITDTLAKIYVKQGLYHKAIYAYEKLCLKYPEKSIYFATQIEEIKSLYIKK
jgi:hypothetical protein